MVGCLWTRAHLGAWEDGESTREVSLRVKEHLAGCSRCRELLQQRRGLLRVLEAASGAPPTPDVIRPVMATIQAETLSESRYSIRTEIVEQPWIFGQLAWLRAGIGCAALMCLLLAGYLGMSLRERVDEERAPIVAKSDPVIAEWYPSFDLSLADSLVGWYVDETDDR